MIETSQVKKLLKRNLREPHSLSTFEQNVVMWFFYGLLVKDINITIPNIFLFILGILQMVLYLICNKNEKAIIKEQKLSGNTKACCQFVDEKNKEFPELTEQQIIDIVKLGSLISSGKIHVAACLQDNICTATVEYTPTLQAEEAKN
ncbi:hypothetical protein RND71_005458 [Anisodus tanguticus]|uniref:Uncharacterized protein n=1 Tax=Anisodus tanguticus TaxID=243964 RepID=A0AAE1SU74_9SOLA|nr:hypothetical protein RND71_005458 [Anisodus tanguticus]